MFVAIEIRSPGDQLLHIAWAFFDEHSNCALITEPRTRLEGVFRMKVRTVARTKRRRNAALCVPSVAFGRIRLRENQHAADGRERDRRSQTGDATANDDVVTDVCLTGGQSVNVILGNQEIKNLE